MIEPTQVIKFSERLALYSCPRRFYFPTEPPSTLVASLLPLVILFSRSFLTPVAASRRFYFSLDTTMRHPSSTPDLSFFFFSFYRLLSRLRRLYKSWAVHERCSIERLSVDFYCFPSRDLFHFVTPISKVVCRPPTVPTSEADRSNPGENVKISHVRRPRDYSSRW